MYSQYINNYENALKLVREVKAKDNKFETFLKHRTSLLEGNQTSLPLDSFLILPVQRLPRYELLLRDIIRYTWEEHKDFASLQLALKAIQKVTSFLNESRRLVETMEKLLSIQRRFTNLNEELLLPHRRYIKHSYLFQLTPDTKTTHKRVCFLFNDILLGADTAKFSPFAYSISNSITNSIHSNLPSFSGSTIFSASPASSLHNSSYTHLWTIPFKHSDIVLLGLFFLFFLFFLLS